MKLGLCVQRPVIPIDKGNWGTIETLEDNKIGIIVDIDLDNTGMILMTEEDKIRVVLNITTAIIEIELVSGKMEAGKDRIYTRCGLYITRIRYTRGR